MTSDTKSRKPAAGSDRGPGLFSRPNRYIRRNKAACLATAISAPLLVMLIGVVMIWIGNSLNLDALSVFSSRTHPWNSAFGDGVSVAVIACVFNFYVSPISIPITWLAISQSVGRLAHRGVANKWPYLRWSAFWGAFFVGGVCALPVFFGIRGDVLRGDMAAHTVTMPLMKELVFFFLGSVLTGGVVGAVSGTLAGWLFIAIVKPGSQLHNIEQITLDAF